VVVGEGVAADAAPGESADQLHRLLLGELRGAARLRHPEPRAHLGHSHQRDREQSGGLGGILFLIIGGVIIGVLGKLVAPGDRDKIPFWLTVLCGIVGIWVGNWLYVDVLGGRCSTHGVDWLRHIVQVIAAAVIVMVAASLTGRSRRV
jgi:uncharacterized membrane protein YeaQ/YmgE (transglycosylase-associated protein family)